MAKYRARSCPNCNYYVGYSIAKPLFRSANAYITSFCLNCSYKLPIHSIVHGTARPMSPLRRRPLRLVNIAPTGARTGSAFDTDREADSAERSISPREYARHLRVLGQELESRRLIAFNLKCTGNDYWVWAQSRTATLRSNPLSGLSKNRLQKLWKNNSQLRTQAQAENDTPRVFPPIRRFRYSPPDLDQRERDEQGRRRSKTDTPPGRSLSQLLRTVGTLVAQRGERLLGICWQELSVSVVVETAQGRHEIDVFRPDNLYDLNVSMHLRRNYRTLSDKPH